MLVALWGMILLTMIDMYQPFDSTDRLTPPGVLASIHTRQDMPSGYTSLDGKVDRKLSFLCLLLLG